MAVDYVSFAVSGNDDVLDLPSEIAENVLVIVVYQELHHFIKVSDLHKRCSAQTLSFLDVI